MGAPPGTFLLRFSDTELGGISIVYNDSVQTQGEIGDAHRYALSIRVCLGEQTYVHGLPAHFADHTYES